MQDERKTLKVFCDTNVLLNQKFNLQDYQKVYISIVSIEELDKLKRDERISFLITISTLSADFISLIIFLA